jgi:hypothetical protein
LAELLGITMGPFNNIGSIFQRHVWAQPVLLAELLLDLIAKGLRNA